MRLKGILCDFNGTLFFDSDLHMKAFRRIYENYGKPVPTDEFMIQKFFGRTNETIYLENFDSNASREDIVKFTDMKENAYRDLCLEHSDDLRLVDGATELLDNIKESGIPFCLATGSDFENVKFYIKHLGIDRWFSEDNMVYANGKFKGKPHPDIYQIAANKIGLAPSECLVFEDGTSGILAANAAEAGAVTVVYESKFPSPLTEETHINEIYHDFKEWKNILAKYGLMR